MGRGIAFACAFANLSVVVQDISEQGIKNCKQYIAQQFAKSVQKGKLTEEQAAQRQESVHYSLSIEDVKAGRLGKKTGKGFYTYT